MRIIKTLSLKKATAQFALFLIALAACQSDDEILNSIDTQNINSESAAEALMNENADIATKVISAMTNSQYAGGDTTQVLSLSSKDSRLTGATVTLYRNGTADSPAGQIIIDFSDGSTDNGVTREGQIKVTYGGKRWVSGSYYKIELADFYRNSVHMEGTDSTTFTSTGTNNDTLQLSFHSTLESGKITFGDGKSAEREGTLNKTWIRYIDINSGKIDPLKGELHITTDSGSGLNKLGKTYMWDITSELVYSLSCWNSDKAYIPIKGQKTLTIGNTKYAIDYGDGTTCDNKVTVNLNGGEKAIIVTGDGN